MVGTAPQAEQDIFDLDLNCPVAIVLGSEAKGIRSLTAKNCDVLTRISIQQNEVVESLNVAVACGICLVAVGKSRR